MVLDLCAGARDDGRSSIEPWNVRIFMNAAANAKGSVGQREYQTRQGSKGSLTSRDCHVGTVVQVKSRRRSPCEARPPSYVAGAILARLRRCNGSRPGGCGGGGSSASRGRTAMVVGSSVLNVSSSPACWMTSSPPGPSRNV